MGLQINVCLLSHYISGFLCTFSKSQWVKWPRPPLYCLSIHKITCMIYIFIMHSLTEQKLFFYLKNKTLKLYQNISTYLG